jgi:molybdate transport system substrate-binding protein
MRIRALLIAVLSVVAMSPIVQAAELHVLAAGSLREVMAEIGDQYGKATGMTVATDFGPSGLLRKRIEKGEHADLFASADMGHPLKLLQDGRATRVAMFTRNALCGFAMPQVGLTTASFLDRLLDPAVKLGTSTPKADPAGDYTWAMFRRADAMRQGSFAILNKKAQQIVGGSINNAPVVGKDPTAAVLSSGRIDLMIGYCSGRQRMRALLPQLQSVEAPREITTGPEYGLAVLKGARPRTADLALFMLSPEGQQILARHGFVPVGLPAASTPER